VSTIDLFGKTAVVTGGSRGIGFAIAEALAEHGCSVVLTSRTLAAAEDAAKKLIHHDVQAFPIACDLRNDADVRRLFAHVRSNFLHLDFLINNAGIYGPAAAVDKVLTDGWNETLETNLTGTFLCTKCAVPLMRAGSVIVNNLSIAAYQVFPNSAAYIASKQGLLGLTNATREDLRDRGIRVLALVAGATDTEIWNQFWPDAPRQKMMQPKDVADAVLNALLVPAGTSVDEIRIMPASGVL
jgi:NAD(P)-dependent dehydrogenase (short-subunit alcohol dehydrogenase family)